MTIHLRPVSPPASCSRPGRRGPKTRPLIEEKPSLFGLAPGGVCPASSVTGAAVRSYRTVSPLPLKTEIQKGGLFSVALSLKSPSPDVIRRRVFVEPGLSSIPKYRGHPTLWFREEDRGESRNNQVYYEYSLGRKASFWRIRALSLATVARPGTPIFSGASNTSGSKCRWKAVTSVLNGTRESYP